MRRLFLDIAPLRLDRDDRWLWSGQVVSGIGNQITRIALPYQVYVLTGSTLAIGLLSLCQLVPILVFALGAGSLADVVDRRRLLMVTQTALAACSLALVLLALHGSPPVIALFAIATLAAGLGAVDQPARASSVPRLVPPERLPSAIALNQLNFQLASIVGPAVGGILIATVGLSGAYAVDVVSFAAALVALVAIRPLPPLGAVTRPGLAAIREGLRYVRERRAILGSFVIDLDAMIFGMPTALFPVSPWTSSAPDRPGSGCWPPRRRSAPSWAHSSPAGSRGSTGPGARSSSRSSPGDWRSRPSAWRPSHSRSPSSSLPRPAPPTSSRRSSDRRSSSSTRPMACAAA